MRARVCAALVALLLAVAGCSSDRDVDPQAGPDASDETSSTSPSSPSPTVEPAEGKQVVVTGFDDRVLVELRLPPGDWHLLRQGESAALFTDVGGWTFDGGLNSYDPDYDTLDNSAKIRIGNYADVGDRVRRMPDRVVDGVKGYVLEKRSRHRLLYEFGAFRRDAWVRLQFDFPNDSAMAREWLESILASVEWQ